MGNFEKTEEGVHPSETPPCGQHDDSQTKAQRRPDFGESSSSDSEDVKTDSVQSADSSQESQQRKLPFDSHKMVDNQQESIQLHREGSFKDHIEALVDSLWSAYSSFPYSGKPPSSDSQRDIQRGVGDLRSAFSQVFVERKTSSGCSKQKSSPHRNIDF